MKLKSGAMAKTKDLVKIFGLIIAFMLIVTAAQLSFLGLVFLLKGRQAYCLYTLVAMVVLVLMGIPICWVIIYRKWESVGLFKAPPPPTQLCNDKDQCYSHPFKDVRTLDLPSTWVLGAIFLVAVAAGGVISFIGGVVTFIGLPFFFLAFIAPALLWISYAYSMDVYEPEPEEAIFKALSWGMFSCVPALFLNTLGELVVGATLVAPLVAPIVEETCKPLGFFLIGKEIDNELDGVIYGISMGVGFALIENSLYELTPIASAIARPGAIDYGLLAFIRGISGNVGHSIGPAAIGFFYGAYKRKGGRNLFPLGWLLGWFMHMSWNTGATFLGNIACFIMPVWMIIEVVVLMVFIKIAQKRDEEWYLVNKDLLDRGVKPTGSNATLARAGYAAPQPPQYYAQYPPQYPGQYPGQYPAPAPYQYPTAYQPGYPVQYPAAYPVQYPGQYQAQYPGAAPNPYAYPPAGHVVLAYPAPGGQPVQPAQQIQPAQPSQAAQPTQPGAAGTNQPVAEYHVAPSSSTMQPAKPQGK